MGYQQDINRSYKEDIMQVLEIGKDIVTLDKPAKMVIDKVKKEYNIIYGFAEERRAMYTTMRNLGYKLNEKLYEPNEIEDVIKEVGNPVRLLLKNVAKEYRIVSGTEMEQNEMRRLMSDRGFVENLELKIEG